MFAMLNTILKSKLGNCFQLAIEPDNSSKSSSPTLIHGDSDSPSAFQLLEILVLEIQMQWDLSVLVFSLQLCQYEKSSVGHFERRKVEFEQPSISLAFSSLSLPSFLQSPHFF